MAAHVAAKPLCFYDDALHVLRGLREAGHVAYFAGGCVRDRVLGLEPKDWDVATDAPPQRVRSIFPRTAGVGAAFGVVLVRHRASTIEVATFRADGDYTDGRRPDSVTFSTPQADAQRRDFTINGLFLDPLDNDRVIDFVGGVDDLHARTLRAIGEPRRRFEEDYLRLLRAARFAARFDLTIEEQTRQAIVDYASRLARIVPERVGDELRAMLTAPTRVNARRLLGELKLLPVLLRFLPDAGVWPSPRDRTKLSLLEVLSSRVEGEMEFTLALASTMLDYRYASPGLPTMGELLSEESSRQAVGAARQAFRLSNLECDELEGLLSVGSLLGESSPTVARMKRFLSTPTSGLALRLLEALCVAGDDVGDRAADLRRRLEEAGSSGEVNPTPLVSGDDLIAMRLKPGPAFKRLLDALYDEQLEGRLTDREAALKRLNELSSRG